MNVNLAWKLAIAAGVGIAAVAVPVLIFLAMIWEVSDVCD